MCVNGAAEIVKALTGSQDILRLQWDGCRDPLGYFTEYEGYEVFVCSPDSAARSDENGDGNYECAGIPFGLYFSLGVLDEETLEAVDADELARTVQNELENMGLVNVNFYPVLVKGKIYEVFVSINAVAATGDSLYLNNAESVKKLVEKIDEVKVAVRNALPDYRLVTVRLPVDVWEKLGKAKTLDLEEIKEIADQNKKLLIYQKLWSIVRRVS